MYAAHQDAQAIRAAFSSPRAADNLSGLNGSASLKEKALTLTVVNPSADTPRATDIVLRDMNAGSGSATVLNAADIHAHNTYENQNAVSPKTMNLAIQGGRIHFEFPPASVTKMELQLT